MPKELTIGRAARRAGVSVETIRYYERRGLIEQPDRPRAGGYRDYPDAIIGRIEFIKQAQDLGFSLREISELLSLRTEPGADCSDVRAKAVAKLAEVNRKIAQLLSMRKGLNTLIGSCPGGGAVHTCTIIGAIAGQQADHASLQAGLTKQRKRTPEGQKMKTASIDIGGMHCEGCAHTIEAILSTETGVRKTSVSFNTHQARVLFDPKATSEMRLVEAIRNIGYTVSHSSS